jgi:hypothetical protein
MAGMPKSGYSLVIDFEKMLVVIVVVKCLAVEQHEQVQKGGQVSWPLSSLGEWLF